MAPEHNSQPFTAAAVKWTFDRIAAAGGGTAVIGENSARIVGRFHRGIPELAQGMLRQVGIDITDRLRPGIVPCVESSTTTEPHIDYSEVK